MSGSPNQFFPGIRVSHQDGQHRVDHASVSGRTRTVIALAFGAGLAAYPHFRPMPLPPAYGPMMALFLPTTALAMAMLLQSLWNRDLFRDRDKEADRIFDAIVFRVILFVVGLHALLLMALTGGFRPDGSAARSALTLFGLTIVGVGNLLPRTRPNLEIGVRTRRTLSDRAAWMQTHRMLGYATVVFGLLMVVAGLLFSKHAIETIVGPSSLAMAALLVFEHVRHRLR
jgi:hypothetical protein